MKFVTTAATIECGHGGKASLKPGGTGLSVDGTELVSVETLPGTPVCGCTQIGPGLVPCMLITSVIQGASPGVKSNGQTPLLDTGCGLTNGSPPGFWSVSDPGQKKAAEAPAGPAPAAAPAPREEVTPVPGVAVRGAAWQRPAAKVGQRVGLTAKYTGQADGRRATFRVHELRSGKPARPLGECFSAPAAGGTLTAAWVAVYPPDAWDQFAAPGRKLPQLSFAVELAGVTAEATKPLELSADLTVRVEDPFGQPLAGEPFVVRCADGTWIKGKKTTGEGRIECAGIHPGPPLVYLPAAGPQYVAAEPPPRRTGLDQVERLAAVARDRLRRVREATTNSATKQWLARLEGDVDRVCVALPKERAMSIQEASPAAVLALGLPLSAETSGAPPVAVVLAVGTVLAAGIMWLSRQQWRSPELQSAASGLKESSKPAPNVELPSGERPSGAGRGAKPTIADAVGPAAVVAAALAESKRRTVEQVPLYWPADHLPWPPGCRPGSVLTRFGGKTRAKRKANGAQAFVNELISDAEAARVSIPEYSRQPFLEDYSRRYPGDADQVARGFRIPIADTPCTRRTEVHDFYTGGGSLRHFHAHHTLPLYFAGGEDVLDNICIMAADCHLRGHVLLRYQDHWKEYGLAKDILKHRTGIRYELITSPDRDLFVPERDPEPDSEEDDYLVGLYPDR